MVVDVPATPEYMQAFLHTCSEEITMSTPEHDVTAFRDDTASPPACAAGSAAPVAPGGQR
jgi:hypothetical protein